MRRPEGDFAGHRPGGPRILVHRARSWAATSRQVRRRAATDPSGRFWSCGQTSPSSGFRLSHADPKASGQSRESVTVPQMERERPPHDGQALPQKERRLTLEREVRGL